MARRDWFKRAGADVFRTLNMWSKALRGQRYAITTVNSNGVEVTRLVDYNTYCEEGYKRNAVVFSSVREIARTAPSARIQVHKRLKRGQTEIYEDHSLQAVFDLPNPRQSHYDFIELLLTYLNLDGNIFILRERSGKDGKTGKTTALWLPRPDMMSPVIDARGQIYEQGALLGYSYLTRGGEKVYFLPEQVIHIKYPDPNDPYHGLGRGIPPLMAAAFDADNDNSQTTFIKQFFKNGAVPSGIIKSKNILDDTEVKRIQNRMAEQYTGEENWHKIMVLDADAEYQATGLSMDEMVFPDLRAISETRICAAFKVPPVLIGVKAGLDAATYSNYKLARQALWEDNIIPTNLKLAEAFTRAFSDELGPDVIVKHDYADVVALQQDRTERFARSSQSVMSGWVTVNEARREIGFGPLPEGIGDVLYRPLMMEPVNDGAGDASMKVLKSQVVKVLPAPKSGSHDPDTALMSPEGSSACEIAMSPVGFLAMTQKGFGGTMIGFEIPFAAATVLANAVGDLPEGSERTPVGEMHITLALTMDPSNDAIMKAVISAAEKVQAIEGKVGGLIRFTTNPEGQIPICAHYDSPLITRFRESLLDALRENGIEPLMTHGFTPHITLAYLPAGSSMPEIEVPEVPLRFDGVTVFGRESERIPVKFGLSSSDDSESEKEKFGAIVHKRFDRIARAWERKFCDQATEIFGREAQGVEAAIRTQKGSIKSIDYNEIWKQIETWLAANGLQSWADGFEPLMVGLISEQMADWAVALGIDWSIENPAVASFIREYSFDFAGRIGETTKNAIRKMMDQAQSEGWSITRMIDDIRSIYSGWSTARAESIARSETIRSSNAGAEEAFRQGGIETEEWYTAKDERVCDFCRQMHGVRIPVGGIFQAAGAEMEIEGQRLVMDYGDVHYPPLHPECRCTILPVISE